MIYFIQQGNSGPVKIGTSKDPSRRLIQLQTASSELLKLIAVMEGNSSTKSKLHDDFHEYHIKGEWFKPATEIFLFIHSMGRGALKAVKCPLCEMRYLPNIEEDVQAHTKRHALILKGALPSSVQELMKERGWAQAREGNYNGKLAVAYAWWARDREAGLPDDAFDEYIMKQLEYIDATLIGDDEMAD